jgi:serine/threonine protein kinase
LLFDQDNELTDESKIQLVRGIAAGMLHLHKHNIVHRDLAARNILLTGNGTPKISVLLFISEKILFFRFIFCVDFSNEELHICQLKSFCRTLECHVFLKERVKERFDFILQTI